MVVMENVSVVMNDNMILNKINLTFQHGEIVALCGANGAGKSTLLRVAAGLLKPTSGQIRYPVGMNRHKWRGAIGTVFPESFLYDALTATENLHFYRRLYRVKEKNKAENLLKEVGLDHVSGEFVGYFSKGMKQRLSIARALLHQPSFLLLDEPFEGLDIESQNFLERMLKQLASRNVGIIVVNHNIEQVWRICDRAVLIHEGYLIANENCKSPGYQSFMDRYRQIVKENKGAIY